MTYRSQTSTPGPSLSDIAALTQGRLPPGCLIHLPPPDPEDFRPVSDVESNVEMSESIDYLIMGNVLQVTQCFDNRQSYPFWRQTSSFDVKGFDTVSGRIYDVKIWRLTSNSDMGLISLQKSVWCTGWLICNYMAFHRTLRFSSACWWNDLDPYSDNIGHTW